MRKLKNQFESAVDDTLHLSLVVLFNYQSIFVRRSQNHSHEYDDDDDKLLAKMANIDCYFYEKCKVDRLSRLKCVKLSQWVCIRIYS